MSYTDAFGTVVGEVKETQLPPKDDTSLLDASDKLLGAPQEAIKAATGDTGIQTANMEGTFEDGGTWGGTDTFNPEQDNRQAWNKYLTEEDTAKMQEAGIDPSLETMSILNRAKTGELKETDFSDYDKDEIAALVGRKQSSGGLTDMQNEDEMLRRSGKTRDEIVSFLDDEGLTNKLYKGANERTGSVNEKRGGTNFMDKIRGTDIGSMSESGLFMLDQSETTMKNLLIPRMAKELQVDSTAISAIYDTGRRVANGQSPLKALTAQTGKAIQYGIKQLAKKFADIPVVSLSKIAMKTYSGVKEGKDLTGAVADSLAEVGIKLGAAALGSMLGPLGTIAATMLADYFITSDLVTQGAIGDAMDSRTNEVFRDFYEEDDSLTSEDLTQLKSFATGMDEYSSIDQAALDERYQNIKVGQRHRNVVATGNFDAEGNQGGGFYGSDRASTVGGMGGV